MDLVSSSIEQGLLFLPLVIGLFLSFRILNLTDLTVDGTFVLGAAVFAKLFLYSNSLALSLIMAILAGVVCGMLVSYLQKDQKMSSLIAGILMGFMLYSVNLQVMETPNLSLLVVSDELQILNSLQKYLVLALLMLLILLFRSSLGLKLRAFGDNSVLLKRLGVSSFMMQSVGLCLANALASLSGALTASAHGYADLHMGLGVALTGIGIVSIGQHLCLYVARPQGFHIGFELLALLVGVFLYFMALHTLLFIGVDPSHLKLFLGLVLILALRTANRGGRSYEN